MRAPHRARLSTLLWALLIAAGLLYPNPPDAGGGLPAWVAAAAHVVLFLVLAWLLVHAQGASPTGRRLAVALALSVLYGGLLELAQIPIEGRAMEWLDVGMNTIGALLGVAAARFRGQGLGKG